MAASRSHTDIRVGLSPRAGLALLNAARACALLHGRGYCVPEDVQSVFVGVAAHRLIPAGTSNFSRDQLAASLLAHVAEPVVVNPDPRLAREAKRRGWRVEAW